MITGESKHILHKINDILYGSTLNISSMLYIKVTSNSNESTLSQIITLIETAQMNKAPIQA